MGWRISKLVSKTIVLVFSLKLLAHRNKCCVQNGTLFEADSMIEYQTVGCEKVLIMHINIF